MTYSNGVDIWALGCIIHEMLTGEIPFLGSIQESDPQLSLETISNDALMPQTDITALQAFCNGRIDLPTDSMQRSGVSTAAVECVKSMLVAIPNSRITAQDALQCEWLRPPADFGAVPELNEEQLKRRNHMWVSSSPRYPSIADLDINLVGKYLVQGWSLFIAHRNVPGEIYSKLVSSSPVFVMDR